MRIASRVVLVLLGLAILLIPAITVGTAVASPPSKSLSYDCTNLNHFGGDVYLKVGESLTVNFVNCQPEIYIDEDTDPSVFTTRSITPSSDGNITYYADGTYIINATVAPGDSQGVWHSPFADYAYMWLDSSSQLMNDFVRINLVGSDASVVSNAQSQVVQFEFPGQLASSDFFVGVSALDACITYDPSQPWPIAGNPVPFKAHDFVVQTGGNVTIRTDSTFPTSSFTSYAEDPSAGYESMLTYANYLLYDNFDPQNPGEGLITCGDFIQDASIGNYLASGEIRERSYAELSTHLDAGTYTLVAVTRESLTQQAWQNFSNNQTQYLFTEIWTPLPQVTSGSVLAVTGRNVFFWAPGSAALLCVGAVMLLNKRYSEKRMRHASTLS